MDDLTMSDGRLPARYQQARRALQEAVRIESAKDIRNKALAVEVYAFQAKDAEMLGWSVEIQKWAERRIGELIAEQRKAGRLAKPPGGSQARPRKDRVFEKPDHSRTLLDQGVDKNLADRARKCAAMTAPAFEAHVARVKRIAVAAVRNLQDVLSEAKAERNARARAKRNQRETELAAKLAALPEQRYGVIYADPEWRFEFWSEDGRTNSSADNHYPTSELAAIKARDVPSIAAPDCALFLWATVPMLPQALEVLEAWGFCYVSQFVWVKDRPGTGFWTRNQHELLLIGTRGSIPAPAPGTVPPSVIHAPRGRHSEKPHEAYAIIEAMYPTLPKIELNARTARPGWDRWGYEAPNREAAE